LIGFEALQWLALTSLAAMALFVVDKHAAMHDHRRVSEATLLGVALLGGWPGAWLALWWLRHKSRKSAFQARLVLVSATSATLWVGLGWMWR
jgi:uncharacterized membrane protein YsdA (DUF1294 family)